METKERAKMMDLVRETNERLVDIVDSKDNPLKTESDVTVQMAAITKVNMLEAAKEQNMATLEAINEKIEAIIDVKEKGVLLAPTRMEGEALLLKLLRDEEDMKQENKRLKMIHADVSTSKNRVEWSTSAKAAAGTMQLKVVFDKLIILEKAMSILFVGLEGSGKKTIFKMLGIGYIICLGRFSVEYNNINFVVADVGANMPLRANRYNNIAALIFVVDSTNDQARLLEAKDELHKLLNQNEIKGAALLVFANKQDIPNAIDAKGITEILGLGSIRDRDWFIQATAATLGIGLLEGLEWLSTIIAKKKVVQPVIF